MIYLKNNTPFTYGMICKEPVMEKPYEFHSTIDGQVFKDENYSNKFHYYNQWLSSCIEVSREFSELHNHGDVIKEGEFEVG